MSNPFVAEVRIFPFNVAPKGWAFCNGQLLPISQNTALFSLLGTTYGGDGKSTFALPNMEGSAPIQAGQGPGLSLYDLGESGGSDFVTLLDTEMPAHSHPISAAPTLIAADNDIPTGNSLGKSSQGNAYDAFTAQKAVQMDFQSISPAGGSLPHNNLMPYLTLNFNIALQGVFPPRT